MTSRLTLLTILLFTFNVNASRSRHSHDLRPLMDQNGAVIPGAQFTRHYSRPRLLARPQPTPRAAIG